MNATEQKTIPPRKSGFAESVKGNWLRARLTRHEISGSLGDMGLFLPLLIGMVTTCGLNFGVALFFAGAFNVLTGLVFSIPMAVQPMKAIAAVAITEHLSTPQILAAGVITGAVILVLGVTNLLSVVMRFVPKSVVRGLQLSVGLTLMQQAVQMSVQNHPWLGADSILAAIIALLFLFVAFARSWAGALWVFIAGLVLAIATHPGAVSQLSFGFGSFTMPTIAAQDWWIAAKRAAIPQIPLTCLNSVIAVCALSRDLFPEKPASEKSVAVSVGLMNLIGCPFGAMPMCHGAGGLAGQFRFGARTNGSILFLGAMKMLVAICFGGSLLALLKVYPQSLLGVLLFFAGLELALVCRDISEREPAIIMLLTAIVGLALKSVAIGFAAGLAVHYFLFAIKSWSHKSVEPPN
jgi:MFS superfamily sulfate permease-like transporter